MHAPDLTHSGYAPSASGGITRLACARALAEGLDVSPILKKCGLSATEIEDRHARLPVKSQIKLLALTAAALPDDLLGFHLALTFDLREVGLLYYTMASSPTLGDALNRASRYSTIVNECAALSLRAAGDAAGDIELLFECVGLPRHSDRHQIEFFLVAVMRVCRVLTGRQIVPNEVRLIHHRHEERAQYGSFFGSDVAFGADRDAILLPRSVRDMPVVNADPYLNDLLVRYCEEALARRPAFSGSLRSAVEYAIITLLPHGMARLVEVAAKLGMSPRTLARRLACENLTFYGVLDELRADLARRHLADPALSISQIAWLLGYQEASAFTHAFRRWTGMTPGMMRSQSQAVAVDQMAGRERDNRGLRNRASERR
jgi:AraC-like DNA-binding protein